MSEATAAEAVNSEAVSPQPALSAAPEKLAFSEKIGYGMGAMTENNMQNTIATMTMPIMNDLMGINSIWLGYAAAVGRVFDSLTDPLMGFISDKTKGRWGRRKPYILSGSVLAAIAFFAVWLFPLTGWSHTSLLFYFLGATLVYYLCTTIYCVPYISYGYELSQDYHERTQLMGFRMFFVSLGNVLVPWVFWFTQLKMFENTLEGMRYASLIIGILFVVCALGPLLMTKRHKHAEVVNPKLKKVRLADILSVLSVKPFLCMVASLGLGVFGVVSVGSLSFYILTYYVCGGDKSFSGELMGLSGTIGGILGVASLPLITYVSKWIGKRTTLALFLLYGAVGTAGNWYFMTPDHPYLSVMGSVFYTPALTALWMLIFSMMADVCEYDEYANSLRREGIFAAVLSWIGKVGITLGIVAGGYVLVWTGYNQTPNAVQAPEALNAMRIWYCAVPSIGMLASALALLFYPLSEQKLNEIKHLLKLRNEEI